MEGTGENRNQKKGVQGIGICSLSISIVGGVPVGPQPSGVGGPLPQLKVLWDHWWENHPNHPLHLCVTTKQAYKGNTGSRSDLYNVGDYADGVTEVPNGLCLNFSLKMAKLDFSGWS